MTARPVIFDITRLITRVGRPVPNGIDRVDLAYASHFLGTPSSNFGALMGLGGKPRLIDRGTACAVADGIRAGWREQPDADTDSDTIIARLLGGSEHSVPTAPSEDNTTARVMAAIRGFRRSGQTFGTKGLWPGQNIATAAPANATFLNVSQFPIWRPHYLSWLRHRPDIRAVFFLHDLLPLEYPEFFRAFEVHRHAGRLAAIARHAAGVIVVTCSRLFGPKIT